MADDFRVRFGFFDHPKTVKLQRLHGWDAVVCFMRLWEFCGRTPGRESGDLRGLDADDIEIAARWHGEPGALVGALIGVRFLDSADGGFVLHDFAEHNPHVASKPDASEEGRRGNHLRWHEQRGITDPRCEFCRGDIGATSGDNRPDSPPESSSLPSDPSDPPDPTSHERSRGTEVSKAEAVLEVRNRAAAECGLSSPGSKTELELARMVPFQPGALDYALQQTAKADNPNWTYLLKCLRNPQPRSRGSPVKRDPKLGYHPGSDPEAFGDGPQRL